MQAPSGTNGYFAVILPQKQFWQGFFLPTYLDTQQSVARMREALREHSMLDEQYVKSPVPGVRAEDQALCGHLCSALASVVWSRDHARIGITAAMVARVSGSRFFAVRGVREKDAMRSSLDILQVSNIDEARTAIKKLPAVMLIEMERLINPRPEPMEDGFHRVVSMGNLTRH